MTGARGQTVIHGVVTAIGQFLAGAWRFPVSAASVHLCSGGHSPVGIDPSARNHAAKSSSRMRTQRPMRRTRRLPSRISLRRVPAEIATWDAASGTVRTPGRRATLITGGPDHHRCVPHRVPWDGDRDVRVGQPVPCRGRRGLIDISRYIADDQSVDRSPGQAEALVHPDDGQEEGPRLFRSVDRRTCLAGQHLRLLAGSELTLIWSAPCQATSRSMAFRLCRRRWPAGTSARSATSARDMPSTLVA
jgi:hypothetical protein